MKTILFKRAFKAPLYFFLLALTVASCNNSQEVEEAKKQAEEAKEEAKKAKEEAEKIKKDLESEISTLKAGSTPAALAKKLGGLETIVGKDDTKGMQAALKDLQATVGADDTEGMQAALEGLATRLGDLEIKDFGKGIKALEDYVNIQLATKQDR